MKKIIKHPMAFFIGTFALLMFTILMPSGHLTSKVTFSDGKAGSADMHGKQIFLNEEANNYEYPAGTFGKVAIYRNGSGKIMANMTLQAGIWGYVDASVSANEHQAQKWNEVFDN